MLYYLSRHNEFGRVKALKITLDLALNCVGRALVTGIVADAVSRRVFVNYLNLKKHKMADNEIKKNYENYARCKAAHCPAYEA